MNMQTLKSSLDKRVRIDQVQRLSSQRQDLGEELMCPAGSTISFDIYGRPATLNTLPIQQPYAASCGRSTYTAAELMGFESNQRPYVPICAAGLRGAADFMGVGRDQMPQNLYGDGYRGNFVRTYPTANNAPYYSEPIRMQNPSLWNKPVQSFSFSMDGTSKTLQL